MARSATFQSGSFGRDPMEAYASKQAKAQREGQEPQEPRRRDVTNSPLPEYPRRWESNWSLARQRAEALFDGITLPDEPASAARREAESLFEPA